MSHWQKRGSSTSWVVAASSTPPREGMDARNSQPPGSSRFSVELIVIVAKSDLPAQPLAAQHLIDPPNLVPPLPPCWFILPNHTHGTSSRPKLTAWNPTQQSGPNSRRTWRLSAAISLCTHRHGWISPSRLMRSPATGRTQPRMLPFYRSTPCPCCVVDSVVILGARDASPSIRMSRIRPVSNAGRHRQSRWETCSHRQAPGPNPSSRAFGRYGQHSIDTSPSAHH
jgi:hypothetical protein